MQIKRSILQTTMGVGDETSYYAQKSTPYSQDDQRPTVTVVHGVYGSDLPASSDITWMDNKASLPQTRKLTYHLHGVSSQYIPSNESMGNCDAERKLLVSRLLCPVFLFLTPSA